MKTPHEISIFGMPLGLPLETLQKGGGTLVFDIPPGKELKKFLALAEVKAVVKKRADTDRQKELLVCGSPPAFRIASFLPQLGTESSTKHFVPKSDLSQELWTCGDFSLRNVKCKEELFSEITHGQHSLCIIEHQNIVVRAAMREYLTQQEKADKSKKTLFLRFSKKQEWTSTHSTCCPNL